eukprot:2207986-Amphidinium_carterae.1
MLLELKLQLCLQHSACAPNRSATMLVGQSKSSLPFTGPWAVSPPSCFRFFDPLMVVSPGNRQNALLTCCDRTSPADIFSPPQLCDAPHHYTSSARLDVRLSIYTAARLGTTTAHWDVI